MAEKASSPAMPVARQASQMTGIGGMAVSVIWLLRFVWNLRDNVYGLL